MELFLNSCGGYACGFSPTSSGTMTLSGTVGGFLDGSRRPVTASSHVTVAAPALPPALNVACPAAVVRGADVGCTIGLSDATLPFTITEITAVAQSGMGVFTIGLSPPGPMAAGSVYTLSGPAVASTALSVSANVVWKGSAMALSKTVNFTVEKRPAELDEYAMTLRPEADGPGNTVKFPTLFTGGGALGLYNRQPPPFEDTQIATAASGPNKGLSYIVSIPGIPASLINLTFAIFPGDPWYEAHPDETGPLNDLGLKICTKSQIDGLRLEIERHEGITQADNSHYGIDQALLRRWKLGAFMGSHVISLTGSPQQIQQQMALDFKMEWLRESAFLGSLQQAFDATDTPAIFAGLGCSIYLKS